VCGAPNTGVSSRCSDSTPCIAAWPGTLLTRAPVCGRSALEDGTSVWQYCWACVPPSRGLCCGSLQATPAGNPQGAATQQAATAAAPHRTAQLPACPAAPTGGVNSGCPQSVSRYATRRCCDSSRLTIRRPRVDFPVPLLPHTAMTQGGAPGVAAAAADTAAMLCTACSARTRTCGGHHMRTPAEAVPGAAPGQAGPGLRAPADPPLHHLSTHLPPLRLLPGAGHALRPLHDDLVARLCLLGTWGVASPPCCLQGRDDCQGAGGGCQGGHGLRRGCSHGQRARGGCVGRHHQRIAAGAQQEPASGGGQSRDCCM
jgi:hypothetical protein